MPIKPTDAKAKLHFIKDGSAIYVCDLHGLRIQIMKIRSPYEFWNECKLAEEKQGTIYASMQIVTFRLRLEFNYVKNHEQLIMFKRGLPVWNGYTVPRA